MKRKLVLKRDVVRELTTDEMIQVVGGTKETMYSCMTFISCYLLDCIATLDDRCIN